MSVYYVAAWSVAEPDAAACEAALVNLAEHIRDASTPCGSGDVRRSS